MMESAAYFLLLQSLLLQMHLTKVLPYILTYLFPAGLYTVVHSVLLRASIYMSLCHYLDYYVYYTPSFFVQLKASGS